MRATASTLPRCPTSSRSAAIPPIASPGARGIGEKRGAELLAQYGSLDAMLEAGRFATEADALRLYRRIATMDRDAPLPPLRDVVPDWARAARHATGLGVPQVARRFEEALTWT